MLYRALDFETTGMPEEHDPHAVCEIGWTDLTDEGLGLPQAFVVDPGRDMPAEARAVHHITDREIDQATLSAATLFQMLMEGAPGALFSHNADYEQNWFTGGGVPFICTYKVALRLWPDAPSHSLQVLRYWLDLAVSFDTAFPPHRAGPDSYVCAALMARILERDAATFDQMVKWSSGPALLPRVPFGKHKGQRWEDVPTGYLSWVVEKSDLDRDAKANAKYHLKIRDRA